MTITKLLKLNNDNYYIMVDVEYKNKNNMINLCLKNYKEDYWDGGDCSILIENIEKNYTQDKALIYDKNIYFMANILYIYDRMPFISGIKHIHYKQNDKFIISETYICKEEIDNYINKFNIKMKYQNTNTSLQAALKNSYQ